MTFINTHLIKVAATMMRGDADTRWAAVADLIESGPLAYAILINNKRNPKREAVYYPDAQYAERVAREYLAAIPNPASVRAHGINPAAVPATAPITDMESDWQ